MTELNKWALLIGINEYLNTFSIRGSVNDARLMADILVSRFGFSPERIRLLLDADATYARILESIDILNEIVALEAGAAHG